MCIRDSHHTATGGVGELLVAAKVLLSAAVQRHRRGEVEVVGVDALADDLSSRPDSPETADWRSIVESAPTFDTAVAQILAGAHQSFVLPKAQFPDEAVLSQGPPRAAAPGGLIRAISERVVERSNQRFETARRDAFVTTLTATGIVAAVAAASWSFARSIVRPITSEWIVCLNVLIAWAQGGSLDLFAKNLFHSATDLFG